MLLFFFRCKKDGLQRSPVARFKRIPPLPVFLDIVRGTERKREKENTACFELSLKNGHVHLDQLFRNDSIVYNNVQFFVRIFFLRFFTISCEYNETDFKRRCELRRFACECFLPRGEDLRAITTVHVNVNVFGLRRLLNEKEFRGGGKIYSTHIEISSDDKTKRTREKKITSNKEETKKSRTKFGEI